jgi:hypothetical protein
MGTSSLVRIKNGDNKILVTIYRQSDGFPTGMGNDLLKILNNGYCTIVDGIQSGQNIPRYFNGIECLAAHVVRRLKEDIGNVYIYPVDSEDELYVYTLSEVDSQVWMTIFADLEIYNGPLKDFNAGQVEREYYKQYENEE